MQTSLDLTGLSQEAAATVENLVRLLRSNGGSVPSNVLAPEEWSVRLRNWAASHVKREIVIDDSRETIYAGRGE